MFVLFTESGVAWDDGHTEPVDTVIFATGYHPNPDYLLARSRCTSTCCGARAERLNVPILHRKCLRLPGIHIVCPSLLNNL